MQSIACMWCAEGSLVKASLLQNNAVSGDVLNQFRRSQHLVNSLSSQHSLTWTHASKDEEAVVNCAREPPNDKCAKHTKPTRMMLKSMKKWVRSSAAWTQEGLGCKRNKCG
jgi:hypothetical protein